MDETKLFHNWLTKLNSLDYAGATREFYARLKWKKSNSAVQKPGPIQDERGNLSNSWSECLANWTDFYAKMYRSSHTYTPPNGGMENPSLDKSFSFEELVMGIASLTEHKAPGADCILSNDFTLLLHVDPTDPQFADDNRYILKYILSILNSQWREEKVSPVFKQSILRPILKKVDSDPTNPANYRPISLLNTLMKLYEALIKTRLVRWLENRDHISPVQAAYRKSYSTCDHILVIQEIFLEYRYNKYGPRGGRGPQQLYFCFLDLKKAFDMVPRDLLFKKLYSLGIQGKMFRVICDLYTCNTARVQVQNFLSEKFEIRRGVLQGSKLGPILFNSSTTFLKTSMTLR